jgi:cytochrome P450
MMTGYFGTAPRRAEEAPMTQAATPLREEDLPRLDVLGESFRSDAHGPLSEVRGLSRFAFSRRGIEVLAHDDVVALLLDDRLRTQTHSTYESYGAGEMLRAFARDGLLSAMQDDRHDRIRRVFLAGFRARQVEQRRGMMRDVMSQLVDELPGAGTVDLVSAVTAPYPMEVLCRIIGIPAADIPRFSAAATRLHLLAQVPLAPGFPAIEDALRELGDYCAALVHERRAHPADDAISALIQAQETAGRVTDAELIWNIANLIFAGQDTTRYQLASAVRAVLEVPGLWDRMAAEPEIVPSVAEETLRWYPVVNFVVRIPERDLVHGGVEMRAGRRVILNVQAASRDPERFATPFTFTPRALGRHKASFDVPFGLGMHFCLGAVLARTEIQEALAVLTARWEAVALDGEPEMTSSASMLHGPEEMPVAYRRR